MVALVIPIPKERLVGKSY